MKDQKFPRASVRFNFLRFGKLILGQSSLTRTFTFIFRIHAGFRCYWALITCIPSSLMIRTVQKTVLVTNKLHGPAPDYARHQFLSMTNSCDYISMGMGINISETSIRRFYLQWLRAGWCFPFYDGAERWKRFVI